MRIAYFAHLNDGQDSGVVAKIAAQVDHWRKAGHQVTLFLATQDDDVSWRTPLGTVVLGRYRDPLSRLRAMSGLVTAIRSFEPDLVYQRWDLFYPPMLRLPSRVPLVVEINTNDIQEYALGSRLRSAYNRLTRGILMGRAAALVFASGFELARRPQFTRFKARKVLVANGIELAAYPSLPATSVGPPRLVFIGTGDAPWHGIDKVVTLARLRPNWMIEVVGKEAPKGDGPSNITWHGRLGRVGVLEVMQRADVGIGALALHRNHMEESCTLKMREYLAVGLPVVYGCHDPDADDLGDYVLRIANTETSVVDEIDRIDEFVIRARGVRIPRATVAHIDSGVKEQARLALFEDIARS